MKKKIDCKFTCLHLDVMLCRILALMEEATSTLNMEKYKKDHQAVNTSSSLTETVFRKTLTQGKVEGSVKVCLLHSTSM